VSAEAQSRISEEAAATLAVVTAGEALEVLASDAYFRALADKYYQDHASKEDDPEVFADAILEATRLQEALVRAAMSEPEADLVTLAVSVRV
jgi:hypothetical protein